MKRLYNAIIILLFIINCSTLSAEDFEKINVEYRTLAFFNIEYSSGYTQAFSAFIEPNAVVEIDLTSVDSFINSLFPAIEYCSLGRMVLFGTSSPSLSKIFWSVPEEMKRELAIYDQEYYDKMVEDSKEYTTTYDTYIETGEKVLFKYFDTVAVVTKTEIKNRTGVGLSIEPSQIFMNIHYISEPLAFFAYGKSLRCPFISRLDKN